MTDTPKYAPEVYLQTALSIQGSNMIQMAGVISARQVQPWDLADIEQSAARVLAAVTNYRKATALTPGRTWTETQALRRGASDRCPDCGGPTLLGCHCFEPRDDSLPSDTEPEAAA